MNYGLSENALTSQSCSNSSVTYPTSRTWFNTVILPSLQPGNKYYYKIVSTNSSILNFLSPRAAGDKTPFAVSNVIDLGVYGPDGFNIGMDESKRDMIPTIDPSLNHTTIGRLFSTLDDYELVIHPGDLGYADDWYLKPKNLFDGTNAYQAILEQFYQQLAPVSSRVGYMASPGNHEAICMEIPITNALLCPNGQKNFTDFDKRFGSTMPSAFPSMSTNSAAQISANKAFHLAKPPFWYSFDYGMVHFVMIDTETDFPDAPDTASGSSHLNAGPFGAVNQQSEFLEADLASVDRTITPWIVLGGHRPWYTTGSGCDPCQAAFEDIIYKYGVDIAVFGHVHNSQRIPPIYNGTVDSAGEKDPKAPLYIVSGGAGNIEGLSSAKDAPAYVAFAHDEDYSYSTMSFLDEHNVRINFIRSSTGEVLDSSTLYKMHDTPFVVQK